MGFDDRREIRMLVALALAFDVLALVFAFGSVPLFADVGAACGAGVVCAVVGLAVSCVVRSRTHDGRAIALIVVSACATAFAVAAVVVLGLGQLAVLIGEFLVRLAHSLE